MTESPPPPIEDAAAETPDVEGVEEEIAAEALDMEGVEEEIAAEALDMEGVEEGTADETLDVEGVEEGTADETLDVEGVEEGTADETLDVEGVEEEAAAKTLDVEGVEEEAAAEAEAPGAKEIGTMTVVIGGGVALAVLGALVALVVYLTRWPEPGPQKANTNIKAAVDRSNKLYERAQKLMANVVFTDASNRIAPFAGNVVTSPEQIKLLPPTTPNPKALGNVNQAVDSLQQALADNRSAREDVKALAHKLLSGLLALKGHYYTAESLTSRANASRLLNLADRSIDVMRTQTASIENYDNLTALTSDNVEALHDKFLSNAKDLKAKQDEVSREIIDLGNKVDGMRDSSAALAVKARAARNESQRAKGQKGIDLLEQALAYEKQTDDLTDRIGKAQDRVRALVVDLRDFGLRRASAIERAGETKAILDNREKEKVERLAERDKCRELLRKSEESAIDLMDKILRSCAEAKIAEAETVNAYRDADKELEAAKAGEPVRYAQYEANKADIAMAVANLSIERLLLQQRLSLLKTSIAELWPKLSPPREEPPAAQKLTTYVADVKELRSNTTTGYQDATNLYSEAIKSAEPTHKWVYQGQLAAAHVGLYRLSGNTSELDSADTAITEALQGRESSPYLNPIVELQRLVADERKRSRSSPRAPSIAP